MTFARFTTAAVGLSLAYGVVLFGDQAAAPSAKVVLTPERIEVFLREARIVSMQRLGEGVTNSRRATLSDGEITHDAHIQVVDESRPVFEAGRKTELNFRDTYRYNIAGYRVARLLGIENVPVSVERRVDGRDAAVTWWVDDVLMDEKERLKKKTAGTNPPRLGRYVQLMRVFDELIQNNDRNQGNMLWTTDWTLWMIDHTRAFRLGRELRKQKDLDRCERSLFEGMQRLTVASVTEAVDRSLTKPEIEALVARAGLLVKHFEALIAARGEAAVLYTL